MKNLLLLLIIISLLGCKEIKEKQIANANTAAYQLNFDNLMEKELGEIIEIHDLIAFKNLPNPGYLKSIDKVKPFAKGYLVLDKSLSMLYLIDLGGEFVRTIGKRGGGPQEFVRINDFDIQKDKGEVHILSNDNKAIYVYDLENNFKRKLQLPFFTNTFSISKTGYYFDLGYDSDAHFNLIKTDFDGVVMHSSFPYPSDIQVMSFEFTGGLNSRGQLNSYTEATSSVIYQVKKDTVFPLYHLHIDTQTTWPEAKKHDFNAFHQQLLKFSTSFLTNDYMLLADALIVEYADGRFNKKAYYKNATKELYEASSKLDRLFRVPVGITDESVLISPVDPQVYGELVEYFPEVEDDLKVLSKELWSMLSDQSNSKMFLTLYSVK